MPQLASAFGGEIARTGWSGDCPTG